MGQQFPDRSLPELITLADCDGDWAKYLEAISCGPIPRYLCDIGFEIVFHEASMTGKTPACNPDRRYAICRSNKNLVQNYGFAICARTRFNSPADHWPATVGASR